MTSAPATPPRGERSAGDARVDSAPRYEVARSVEMLRVAASYIRRWAPDDMIHYDETDCDGSCVADDCEAIAADLEHVGRSRLIAAAPDMLAALKVALAGLEIADRGATATALTVRQALRKALSDSPEASRSEGEDT